MIPNAVEVLVKADKVKARQNLGWAIDWPVAVCVSKFAPRKNQALLVRAWPEVTCRIPKARLALVGDGTELSTCQDLAHALGISERVIFAGAQPETSDYLAACDLFVFPSQYEGQPNALLEAMACGLPCAVSDIPGCRSLADPEREALFFSADDAETAAAAVARLFGDPTLAQRLGTAARRRAEREHSLDSVVNRFLAVYERIAK